MTNELNMYQADGSPLEQAGQGTQGGPTHSAPAGDMDALAASLYPREASPEPAAQGNPYSLAGSGEAALADRMYGGTDAVQLDPNVDLSTFVANDEEHGALRTNLGYIASEIGASQSDMAALVDLARRYQLQPPTEAQRDSARSQGMAALSERYGEELSGKLTAASNLVHSLPDLRDWLEQSGAGNDIGIIETMIRLAESPRARARADLFLRGTRG